jgi:hypothetical protein
MGEVMENVDKEYLRALYAGMAMMGMKAKDNWGNQDIVAESFEIADLMMEFLEPKEETGIVKARRKKNV